MVDAPFNYFAFVITRFYHFLHKTDSFHFFFTTAIIMADTYTVEGIVRALVRDAGE
jgi:hypothetical protein